MLAGLSSLGSSNEAWESVLSGQCKACSENVASANVTRELVSGYQGFCIKCCSVGWVNSKHELFRCFKESACDSLLYAGVRALFLSALQGSAAPTLAQGFA